MFRSPLIQYALPALIVGAAGGYFVSDTLARRSSAPGKKSSLRADFLSSDDEVVDYEKLASVCLTASRRGTQKTTVLPSAVADADDPKVIELKDKLDAMMAASIDDGRWTQGTGMAAKMLLARLPPSDVADFEALLRETVQRGDMKVQPGAWLPARLD